MVFQMLRRLRPPKHHRRKDPRYDTSLPPPLPSRTCVLTLPIPGDQVQTTHDQIESAFFSKPPLEIRMEIYKKVLGQRNIHLGQDKLIRPTTLRMFACNRDDDFTNYHLDCYTPKERANRDKEPKLALLSLPQSCRKM